MSIWFRLNASFEARTDNEERLAAALAVIEELVPESIYRAGAAITVEASHEMSHSTAEELEAAVNALVRDYGAGEAVLVETKYEDDDTFTYFVGPKVAVVAALQTAAAARIRDIQAQLARELGKLGDQPADACVETEGW